MSQLVELRNNSKKDFEKHNVEVIAIFREEKEGQTGLKKIQKRAKTEFTLALDLDKKKTGRYSPKRRTFDNYVIDKSGKIIAIIDGTLRVRGKFKQIADILDKHAK